MGITLPSGFTDRPAPKIKGTDDLVEYAHLYGDEREGYKVLDWKEYPYIPGNLCIVKDIPGKERYAKIMYTLPWLDMLCKGYQFKVPIKEES